MDLSYLLLIKSTNTLFEILLFFSFSFIRDNIIKNQADTRVGLVSVNPDNQFTTLSGELPTFVNWNQGEPTTATEQCVIVKTSKMFDTTCDGPSRAEYVLCQRLIGEFRLIWNFCNLYAAKWYKYFVDIVLNYYLCKNDKNLTSALPNYLS